MSLYANHNAEVVELTDPDFITRQNGGVQLKVTRFSGSGLLQVYASWCPHCQNSVEPLVRLARSLANHNMTVYVIDAGESSENSPLSKLGVEGFPTYGYVDEFRNVTLLHNDNGDTVHSIPESLGALCGSYKKLCDYK